MVFKSKAKEINLNKDQTRTHRHTWNKLLSMSPQHHDSASTGTDTDGEKRQQVEREKAKQFQTGRDEPDRSENKMGSDRVMRREERKRGRRGERFFFFFLKKALVLRAQIFLHTSFLSMSPLHPLTRSVSSTRHLCPRSVRVCAFRYVCVWLCRTLGSDRVPDQPPLKPSSLSSVISVCHSAS